VSSLSGRHALVTGANRGIGAAIVRALSSEGASVTLMVRDAARAETVTASLTGPNAVVIADLTNPEVVQTACTEAAHRLGSIDILVNNAGYTETAPFLKTQPDLFERMIGIHLLGAVHTMQAILPAMIERGRGHVVNVASTAGLRGEAYVSAYVAAKHALVGLTRSVAIEMSKRGIAVNAVCPGYTETDLVQDAVARVAAKTGKSEADALRSILANAGQARMVTPEEVAAAVVRLCTAPEAETGQTIVIDGSAR
jgi:NAD(P)-dependent dehydrogenase (short-subunit alcohol dehydrogenase family)